MDQAMEQCLQALNFLYNAADPAAQKQADAWLVQFQQTPAAWQVADAILTRADTPMQFRFFAAQTMRTKVQFDFYELPPDSYGSLRDSLLNHLDRFRAPDCQPIHTQLAIAVADLAIQMDTAWPDVVSSFFERFGQNPESYATLLEVLRMLPEENLNHKLMTDSHKRYSTRDRFHGAAGQVVHFMLNLQCPNIQAKKKVLECFLSWLRFTNLQPGDMAQNPLLPECFKFITEGGELSELATDIVIELLKMASCNVAAFQPLIEAMMPLVAGLRQKFQSLCSRGTVYAVEADRDGLQQICRIYVEVAECLIPLIIQQSTNPDIVAILQVVCACTDLPVHEISSIPLEFWHRLANEVCRHPETDAKIDEFKGIYVELLGVLIRRCTLPSNEDPFQADDEFVGYRQRLLNLAEDCLDVLTPNTALEHVLRSLQEAHRGCIEAQEAHFFCLTIVGQRAEVRDESVLWQLIQSLPPLISQVVPGDTAEAAMLHFTKKTAIELLGKLDNWLKTKPDFMRSALDMISMLLLATVPPESSPNIVERNKQVQQSSAIAFKEICNGGRHLLHDLVPQLIQLYTGTMMLPVRMHLFIVDGVGTVVAQIRKDDDYKNSLEALVQPLLQGLQSEREKPNVLCEILDRLVSIIQKLKPGSGSAKAAAIGALICNIFWPQIRQTLTTHPADAKVVEKSCRLLKHSMRCVPDLFKPIVSAVATTLISMFQQHQHSSYCYSAEILANTYAHDQEIVPILTHLFHNLSSTALQCLIVARDMSKLEDITELVEDFYGMFERYFRYVPSIVLEAPTLPPTLQLLQSVIYVQQKDAIEAIIAFLEAVLERIAEATRAANNNQTYIDARRVQHGQQLHPHVLQVSPGLMEAIFRLMAGVPISYLQEIIPAVLEGMRAAFPNEFPVWLEAAFQHLPPSVASQAERQIFGERLVQGDSNLVYDAVQDICYRCEQVALRNRVSTGSTTNRAKEDH